MNRYFDVSSATEGGPVALVLGELSRRAEECGVTWVVIGAAARDLVLHFPGAADLERATKDVDVAISVPVGDSFRRFTDGLKPLRGEHKFDVLGVEVDIVPFGGVERDGQVTFVDGHVLDVVGLSEAAKAADQVRVAAGLTVPVAGIESQSVLKLLAWRDRSPGETKDAWDLRVILLAASMPPYDDEVWGDDEALAMADHDIRMAGAAWCGMGAGRLLVAERAAKVTDLLAGEDRSRLVGDMRDPEAQTLLDAYESGFRHSQGNVPVFPA